MREGFHLHFTETTAEAYSNFPQGLVESDPTQGVEFEFHTVSPLCVLALPVNTWPIYASSASSSTWAAVTEHCQVCGFFSQSGGWEAQDQGDGVGFGVWGEPVCWCTDSPLSLCPQGLFSASAHLCKLSPAIPPPHTLNW